jgi:hypothetical protein
VSPGSAGIGASQNRGRAHHARPAGFCNRELPRTGSPGLQ